MMGYGTVPGLRACDLEEFQEQQHLEEGHSMTSMLPGGKKDETLQFTPET